MECFKYLNDEILKQMIERLKRASKTIDLRVKDLIPSLEQDVIDQTMLNEEYEKSSEQKKITFLSFFSYPSSF